ncbi:hypothetical protein GCM10011378_16360 [Hymenobacter glacieicola]|uniref:Uncharacterized protein n=1 Tax=Hymenobacter glacieicola TaxID=1562124 RepID=A0ABQ1WS66_9BACT|nr:hypothetical protein GCM10011378_16360 [Hymenobacter glacieicola]
MNKDKPELRCNGRCHLTKQLRKATEAESKAAGYAKIKYEVLSPAPYLLPPAAATLRPAAECFASRVASCYAFSPAHSVFHPPAVRA